MKVLIMGLGLHGGGLQSALFMLKRGAEVTVTDLRDENILRTAIEQLEAYCSESGNKPIRYVLGSHEIEDFKNVDIVIKNPGVRPDSPYLQAAKRIETDISLFLSESPARLFAVSGTKGKSGTVSALHWILKKNRKSGRAFLGGNITVSPLTFLDELRPEDDVALELSSFQLGDIKNRKTKENCALLNPAASILTSIMSDHLDRYASMEEYIDDKKNIYRGQDEKGVTIAGDDNWGKSFRSETKARPLVYSNFSLTPGLSGGWIESGKGFARLHNWEGVSDNVVELVPQHLPVPGEHQKINSLAAALAAYSIGISAENICNALASYPGIEHRLELFHEAGGVRFYNDSAATVPQACAACIEALCPLAPVVLVTGGTDKNLDFHPLANAAAKAKALILLAGTGSEKLAKLLTEEGFSFNGPYDDLNKAVSCAFEKAASGDIVALSPGCASFGMFLNEFDRGRKWKEACLQYSRG